MQTSAGWPCRALTSRVRTSCRRVEFLEDDNTIFEVGSECDNTRLIFEMGSERVNTRFIFKVGSELDNTRFIFEVCSECNIRLLFEVGSDRSENSFNHKSACRLFWLVVALAIHMKYIQTYLYVDRPTHGQTE